MKKDITADALKHAIALFDFYLDRMEYLYRNPDEFTEEENKKRKSEIDNYKEMKAALEELKITIEKKY